MPITLITGLPGHGKTLYTIARYKEIAEKEGRAIYHNGIKGLTLPWQEWEVEDWDQLPAGAIFIIDECQFKFPTRGKGAPPKHIEDLAVHRHKGVDFVLITQNPMLLDSFVRRLCDRHFHVIRKFGTHSATIHEFANGVKESVATSREGSIRHEWRYPKDVFDLYKSAELHTVKRRIPARVYLLFAMPPVALALAWFAWQRLNPEEKGKPVADTPPASVSTVPPGTIPIQPGGSVKTGAASRPGGLSGDPDWVDSQQPRIPGLAYTAPAYDELTRPVRVPFPAACLATADRCSCYTTQATRLSVPDNLCRSFAAGGFFIHWAVAPEVATVAVRSLTQADQTSGGLVTIDDRPVQVSAPPPAVAPPQPVRRR
jgi:hypothetical protein